ncbi:ABC transporter permease [Actinomycetospora corticicola]|uniref:Peptide/nickel transport system permease protein n=1 Tax=Actinomycetospora corticicola TaxID=663602 RepID=A0A7Y9E1K8_9PSEU|nr:ABC transporter permease [Actinomycetospora corticicola]NYD39375.1 peptide/nickel transport system permease protein [Actinomycetospora corticicola]
MAETTQTTPATHPGKVPDPPSGRADGGDVGGAFLTQGQLVRRRFLRHRAAMTALTILVLFILFVYIAPFFLGYSLTNLSAGSYEDPSPAHIFGTDQVGADVFSLVMKGSQFSLQIGFIAAVISTVVGVLLGTTAGYLRRGTDTAVSRVTDLFLVVPLQAVAAILIAGLGGSWWLVGLILGFFLWMPIARVTRAEALALAQREFVEAARASGATTWRIVTKHLVPNMIGTIVVNATLTLALAVLTEAALSFIGLGVQIPDTSLGLVLNQNYTQLGTRPWLFWAPFVAIVLISLTINFIGDGLRDAFDPRQTRR